MQGVTLLAGLALLGSLAVPVALPASEQAPGEVAGEIVAADPGTGPGTEADPPDATDEPVATPAPEPEARAAATRTVLMEDIKFKPRKIRIDPGDTVQWENRDEARHDALGENGRFETPIIDRGETSSHTFDSKGRFPYFCSIHEGMTGTIQVGASSSGGGGGGGGGGSGGTGSDTGGTGSGTGAIVGPGSSGTSSGTGSGASFGSTSSGGTGSTLASTGSELLWLGLVGYGLVAVGAFAGLAAISRPS